ncbi:hypothetical protein SAMN05216312_110162 [Cohnella sp. OV330]|uniref:hypothetical protein n=1 Tax=Cohnella sp. OV330 TaxID=1855288 RepID=UPI0008E1C5EC|nr:hypothetical protein [Cohnella sp. OV330]SFB49915.1 hypothetical protein SAMN05216312_110162 [Cohnella sp. OV330]
MVGFDYKAGWKGLSSATAIITLLAACSTAEAPGRETTDDRHNIPSSSATANSGMDASKAPDASASPGGKTEGVQPVASIPEKDVYLYADTETAAVLAVGDARQTMDWTYSTVRGVTPVLTLGDYDHDGEDELAAVLELGSGTGLLIDELHVVELAGMEAGASGERPFADHAFQEEDYLAQLGDALSFEKVDKDGKWFGEIAIGDRTYEVDLDAFVREHVAEALGKELGYGAIVYFRAEDEGLTFQAAVGLRIDGFAEPQYIGDITASVSYDAGKFKLGNFAFAAE